MNINEQLATFSIIETERLLLRPFTMDDAADMFAFAGQPDNLIYVYPAHKDIAETRHIIANKFMKTPLGMWAIENKEDHKMIGTISFVKLDKTKRCTEIGYVLNQAYWGVGLMTEAVRTLSELSLTVFGLKFVEIVADIENTGSVKVAEKSGFKTVDNYKAINPYTKELRQFYRFRKGKYE